MANRHFLADDWQLVINMIVDYKNLEFNRLKF